MGGHPAQDLLGQSFQGYWRPHWGPECALPSPQGLGVWLSPVLNKAVERFISESQGRMREKALCWAPGHQLEPCPYALHVAGALQNYPNMPPATRASV